MRWVVLLLVLAGVGAGAAPAQPKFLRRDKGQSGDAVIRGKAGPSDIVITTTHRLAGAIHSLTWGGKEFIDSADHGRQLQSAAAFANGDWKDFSAETYNPTEAGSMRDGEGPRSTSKLVGLQAKGNELTTIIQPAFWLAPGEKDQTGRLSRTTKVLSDHLITKQVKIGYKQYANVIDYRVTFTTPKTEAHNIAQFEAVTGYMPGEFSKFWTLDPKTGQLAPLTDGPGEQAKPVVFSTENQLWAMGVWSPGQPSKGFETIGYGRFRFAALKVVKWNCVFRLHDPAGLKPGNYTYQMYVAVGTLKNVQDALFGVMNEKEFKK